MSACTGMPTYGERITPRNVIQRASGVTSERP